MNSHPASIFSISTGSSDPIYRQLMDQARRLVASGQLAAGDLLPSVRDVAQTLALNPMTVSKAYNMLETEGLFQRRRGAGMLVAGRAGPVPDGAARENLLRPTLERALQEARELELGPDAVIELFKKIIQEQA